MCYSFCPCSIRISEGFHFAASGEGIVNMVMELPMKVFMNTLSFAPQACHIWTFNHHLLKCDWILRRRQETQTERVTPASFSTSYFLLTPPQLRTGETVSLYLFEYH